jgi:hypothetical protein
MLELKETGNFKKLRNLVCPLDNKYISTKVNMFRSGLVFSVQP